MLNRAVIGQEAREGVVIVAVELDRAGEPLAEPVELGLVAAGDGDLGALLGEHLRAGQADPRSTARDEDSHREPFP